MEISVYAIPGVVNKSVLFKMNNSYWAKILKKEVDLFLKEHGVVFGMYPKVKYSLHIQGKDHSPIYFFTTTRYTEKQALDMLIEYSNNFYNGRRYFIYKESNKVRKLIHSFTHLIRTNTHD